MINNTMSNIILPIDHIDFSASVEEMQLHIEDSKLTLFENSRITTSYILVDAEAVPITSSIISELNGELLTIVYVEINGGIEAGYGEAPAKQSIILPLEETSSTLNRYSISEDAVKTYTNVGASYLAEDCTLVDTFEINGPAFLGTDFIFSLEVPAGETFKALILFFDTEEEEPVS
jgi:hypothetical protein